MKYFFALIIAIVFNFIRVYSQSSAPLFMHYSPENGLPSSQVYQVLQDKKGYLWFATDHGVCKYNGYEFKTFTTADGLTDNTVFKIFLDRKDRLWMQTFSGQLFYFEKEKITAYKYNDVLLSIVKSNIPLGFYVDSLDEVYFTCSFIGEHKIGSNGTLQTIYKYVNNNRYNQVFLDVMDDNSCLVSGNTQTNFKKSCYLFYENGHAGFDSILIPQEVSGQVFAWRLNNNKVLFSVSKYLFEFNNGVCRQIAELPAVVNYLYQDKSDRIWVCTILGLFLLETNKDKIRLTNFLGNDIISCMAIDNEGGIWITSINNGVFYLPDGRIKSYIYLSDSLKEPLCLTAGRDAMYAGFWNGKMVELNTSSFKTVYSSSQRSNITSLFYDTISKRIYVASDPAGFLENSSFTAFGGKVTNVLKGNYIRRKNGNIYNASINGIYEILSNDISIVSALNHRVNCIYENSNGELLIGCNNGAFIFNEQTKSCTLINEMLSNTRIDDIKLFNENLCFATRGKGLFVMCKNQIVRIDASNGLCSNILHKLTVSNDAIWCASYNGISKVSIKNNLITDYAITNININDGLPNNEINDISVLNDTLWVASKSAISFFGCRTDFMNPVPPEIHFTSFKKNNVVSSITDKNEFPYHSNTISISFEALSFKSAGEINYKYLLLNESDSLESTTKNRTVDFLSLAPGHYVFQVKAMNRSGIWSVNPVQLKFTILKPVWQRWWFLMLVFLTLVSIIYYILRERIRRVRKEEKIKTDFNKQIVQLEMKALRAQMNPHFVFNVLNSIQDYILNNDALSAQKYLTKFARLVRLILANSMEGEVVLQEELKAAGLYVELEQQRFGDIFQFELFVSDMLEVDEILIPSMIIQPFLENAIKHGVSHLEKEGKISLTVTEKEGGLLICIADNGVGRAASAEWNKKNVREHISYGSAITAKRISVYNIANNTSIQTTITDLKYDEGVACGTKVEIFLPIKYKGNLKSEN